MAAFDAEAAAKAGYSPEEIAAFQGQIDAAKKAGHSDEDIQSYLSAPAATTGGPNTESSSDDPYRYAKDFAQSAAKSAVNIPASLYDVGRAEMRAYKWLTGQKDDTTDMAPNSPLAKMTDAGQNYISSFGHQPTNDQMSQWAQWAGDKAPMMLGPGGPIKSLIRNYAIPQAAGAATDYLTQGSPTNTWAPTLASVFAGGVANSGRPTVSTGVTSTELRAKANGLSYVDRQRQLAAADRLEQVEDAAARSRKAPASSAPDEFRPLWRNGAFPADEQAELNNLVNPHLGQRAMTTAGNLADPSRLGLPEVGALGLGAAHLFGGVPAALAWGVYGGAKAAGLMSKLTANQATRNRISYLKSLIASKAPGAPPLPTGNWQLPAAAATSRFYQPGQQ